MRINRRRIYGWLAQYRRGGRGALKAKRLLGRPPNDRRFVGGTVGVLAVLHTWTQQLVYHPHVHCLVTGGGISDDGRDWSPARKAFLVPHMAYGVRRNQRCGNGRHEW